MNKLNPKVVCIIPARGGSKRIKNKNIKIIDKKPLIGHVIETCIKSKKFKDIIVSTDSKKIKKIISNYRQVKVPELRPAKYSNDNATINLLIKYLFKKYNLASYDYLFCIFPTAILIKKNDIHKALNQIIKTKSSHLLTISQYKNEIQRSIQIKKKKIIYNFKDLVQKKNKSFTKNYFDTGSFFIHKIKDYKKNFNEKPKNSTGYIIDYFRAVDVNDLNDLKMLKLIYKYLNNKNA